MTSLLGKRTIHKHLKSEVCSELDLGNYAAGFVNLMCFAYLKNLHKNK